MSERPAGACGRAGNGYVVLLSWSSVTPWALRDCGKLLILLAPARSCSCKLLIKCSEHFCSQIAQNAPRAYMLHPLEHVNDAIRMATQEPEELIKAKQVEGCFPNSPCCSAYFASSLHTTNIVAHLAPLGVLLPNLTLTLTLTRNPKP